MSSLGYLESQAVLIKRTSQTKLMCSVPNTAKCHSHGVTLATHIKAYIFIKHHKVPSVNHGCCFVYFVRKGGNPQTTLATVWRFRTMAAYHVQNRYLFIYFIIYLVFTFLLCSLNIIVSSVIIVPQTRKVCKIKSPKILSLERITVH